jgi:serine protease Do
MNSKNLIYIFIGVVIGAGLMGGGGWLTYKALDRVGRVEKTLEVSNEESVVTRVVEKATPSVVTVSISKINKVFDPFAGFDFFGGFGTAPTEEKIEKDIGTGFIISADGLVVTNKHVVSDTSAKYKVVIGKDEVVEVMEIYRDPENDLAILKVKKDNLVPVTLGDSDKIKVGQTVIAIGTALGEFRSTVTTGVISGLGRGIVAGSPLEGSEKLSNVIQTDAAINPGNSGGPLFNSSGEVIGVNVAVSQNGQGIGFALPINMVKESINNFKTTGEFDRPYLGVGYQIISKQAALLNEVPAGAYIRQIGDGSPAQKAELKVGDIITEIDGNKIVEDFSIANYINKKKIGDTLNLKVFREDKDISVSVRLEKRE